MGVGAQHPAQSRVMPEPTIAPNPANEQGNRVLRPHSVALTALISLFLTTLVSCGGNSNPAATPGATTNVTFENSRGEDVTLTVEIADTPDERARGLMGREALSADSGMLFVWPEDTGSGFWMKDTLIPLSIAFIDSGGAIVDIQDMEPLDETLHRSPKPYRWAVEANQGWFEEHGIGVGDTTQMPDSIAEGS